MSDEIEYKPLTLETIEKEFLGLHNACIYFKDRNGTLIFISYKEHLYPGFIVALKIYHDSACNYEARAKTLGIIKIDEPEVSEYLSLTIPVGYSSSTDWVKNIIWKKLFKLGFATKKNYDVKCVVDLCSVENTSLYFKTSKGDVVGICYKSHIVGVPVVSFKENRNDARDVEQFFKANNIPMIDDVETANILFETGKVSLAIPKETFSLVARAMLRAKIINRD